MDPRHQNLLIEVAAALERDPDIASRLALMGTLSMLSIIAYRAGPSYEADVQLGAQALNALAPLTARTQYLLSLETMPYAEYLQTPEWKAKAATKRLLHPCCEECGAGDDLEVHHLTYAHRGRESWEDLRVLCRACHRAAHDLPAADEEVR